MSEKTLREIALLLARYFEQMYMERRAAKELLTKNLGQDWDASFQYRVGQLQESLHPSFEPLYKMIEESSRSSEDAIRTLLEEWLPKGPLN